MVVQMAERRLRPIIIPTCPNTQRGKPDGFARVDDQIVLTDDGYEQAAIVQRMMLRCVVLGESHDQIAERYGYSHRQTKQIVIGRAWEPLSRPIRARLIALGLGDIRTRRTAKGRAHFKTVLQRVAGQAARVLMEPNQYSAIQRKRVALDLYILSGSWADDEAGVTS